QDFEIRRHLPHNKKPRKPVRGFDSSMSCPGTLARLVRPGTARAVPAPGGGKRPQILRRIHKTYRQRCRRVKVMTARRGPDRRGGAPLLEWERPPERR